MYVIKSKSYISKTYICMYRMINDQQKIKLQISFETKMNKKRTLLVTATPKHSPTFSK